MKIKQPELKKKEIQRFTACISTDLTSLQKQWITEPAVSYPRQKTVLAVHWHPEYVPMKLIRKRIDVMYPKRKEELIIPTQHNQLVEYDDYAGVEVDCYSSGFHSKVQLLIHMRKEKQKQASVFKNILKHTFTYRSSQLFSFLHALIKPDEDILNRAAVKTGASAEVVNFAREQAKRLELLLDYNFDSLPKAAIKNKLIRDYVNQLDDYDENLIQRTQAFLRAVKGQVKQNFPLNHFYRTNEVIEEARGLGAGIIIPHPEQFWPILLADYDVDGYEVWNPQSQEYTEFLVTVLNRRNKQVNNSRPLLVFMGDDTHMSEKTKTPENRDPAKAVREIGFQPPWDDMQIRKQLLKAGMDRSGIIAEYKARLAS